MAKESKSKPGAPKKLDFTKVKDGGGRFNKRRQKEGGYKGKITKVETVPKKNEPSVDQWLFTITAGSGTYPYYCGFEENVLWKIRNLFVAAGVNIPKKAVTVDPTKVVGKEVGVELEDDEYDGKKQSSIAGIVPLAEIDLVDASDDDDDDEEDSPKPAKKDKGKKKKKSKDLEELDVDDI